MTTLALAVATSPAVCPIRPAAPNIDRTDSTGSGDHCTGTKHTANKAPHTVATCRKLALPNFHMREKAKYLLAWGG